MQNSNIRNIFVVNHTFNLARCKRCGGPGVLLEKHDGAPITKFTRTVKWVQCFFCGNKTNYQQSFGMAVGHWETMNNVTESPTNSPA